MENGRRKILSERIADELYELIIIKKEFGSGDKLPNENELAARLGVSRTTLREAVRSLVSQGILCVKRGLGTFISDELPSGRIDVSSLERTKIRVMDMYEMRLIFEPECIRLACARATDDEIDEICRQGAYVCSCLGTDKDWPGEDQRFHEMIAAASHNSFLLQLYPIINHAVHDAMKLSGHGNEKSMEDIVASDNPIMIEFLRKRDGAGAKAAMSIHMRHVLNTLKL